MEKMFKRTLLCAAVATAAMASTGANAAIDLLDGNVQLYGQAAGGLIIANPDEGDSNVTADIESRIGFRGKVDFDNFGPSFIWQIEGGNAANQGFDAEKGWTHVNNGQFGARDTFVGLEFDGVGQFKFGRQLVAAYNYVDWPHSNPGIGQVFDYNQDIGASFEDRANHVVRFDSANFGGFNFQATLSGMEDTTDQMAVSLAGSYTADSFTIHGGYYTRDDLDGKLLDIATVEGNSYFIVGGAAYLGDVTLTAAAKYMETETNLGDADQWAYSATAQYIADGTWLYKLGVAIADDAEFDGTNGGLDSDDLAVTGRIGYLVPSAIFYADVRHTEKNALSNDNGVITSSDSEGTNIHLGVEYYF